MFSDKLLGVPLCVKCPKIERRVSSFKENRNEKGLNKLLDVLMLIIGFDRGKKFLEYLQARLHRTYRYGGEGEEQLYKLLAQRKYKSMHVIMQVQIMVIGRVFLDALPDSKVYAIEPIQNFSKILMKICLLGNSILPFQIKKNH